jgi:hypothetical protein
VGAEVVGESRCENECDRSQTTEDAYAFAGRRISPPVTLANSRRRLNA